ncbi:MAG: iron ABC transporter [Phycisphaerae bacterium]|nr:iron ABC transporter [Phycisphaerae bacterium]
MNVHTMALVLSDWSYLDTWIVAIGALCAMACASCGCFLVLRRMSMMGDAISHGVLPGIVIAFLVSSTRSSTIMFIGAALAGLLTALASQWLSQWLRVERSGAIGVVFTTLFALGILLIVVAADSVELDPHCVLYGEIALAPLDVIRVGGIDIPRAALSLGIVWIVNLGICLVLLKELRMASFDPQFSRSIDFKPELLNALIMTMVAVTTVAAFESVGSILVLAMLVIPPVIARLLSDRFTGMLWWCMLIGVVASIIGHVGAITLPRIVGYESTNTAGMMTVSLVVLLALVILIAPGPGILAQAARRRRHRLQVAQEDLLGLLFRMEEANQHQISSGTLLARAAEAGGHGRAMVSRALGKLLSTQRIQIAPEGVQLRESGRREASQLVRSHRLWERYLSDQVGLQDDHVHETAMMLEHVTSPEMQSRLAEESSGDRTDPHGRPIPGSEKD